MDERVRGRWGACAVGSSGSATSSSESESCGNLRYIFLPRLERQCWQLAQREGTSE